MSDPNSSAAGPSGNEASDPANPLKLAVAWLFVGVPLAWGVWQVVVKTLDLFTK
jgi:hypothetical protein